MPSAHSLPPFPSTLRPHAQKIAQHEMGHFVVATILGVRTGDVELQVDFNLGHRGGANVKLARGIELLADVSSYLEKRIKVLYAGAAAETLVVGAPKQTVDQEKAITFLRDGAKGAEQDHAKVRELLQLLRCIRYPHTDPLDEPNVQTELTKLDVELWNGAVALVEKHAAAICSLAMALVEMLVAPGQKVVWKHEDLQKLSGVKKLVDLADAQQRA